MIALNVTPIPWFPMEIIEDIISEAWSSPLSVHERITLMASSLLVSKSWMVAFTRVSSRDVYIPCASYAEQYFRILRGESPIYDDNTRGLPDLLCRSLTFQLQNAACGTTEQPMVQLFGDKMRTGEALSSTLYTIRSLFYLPNLRRVSIEYSNWGFDDLFDHYRLVAFPDQVTELELKYSFRECTPPWLINDLRSSYVRQDCLQWALPSIRKLSVMGSGENLLMDIASACPNVNTVITDTLPQSPA